MKLAALVVGMFACSGKEPREQPRPQPAPGPKPIASALPAVDDDRWLLLVGHANTAATASYLAVDLGTDPGRLEPLAAEPALPIANWPGHYKAIVAQHRERWARAVEDGGGHRVVVGVMSGVAGGKPTRSVAVPFAPAALHLAGDAVFVGGPTSVGWIDLSAASPTYAELARRDHPFKAYDLFVRDGARLLAIDDEVMPMYADWFALDGRGRPTKRLGDWTLPGVINGHYTQAALLATGANEWILVLLAPYTIRSGSGHDLAAIPIRNDRIMFDPDLTLQNADGKTPILEEHADRDGGKPPRLIAGSSFSPWTGLALVRAAKRILVAAGPRGLLALPVGFTATTRAAVTDLGGDVRDVITRSDRVYALVVRADVCELVTLTVTATSVAEGTRHRLPAVFDRFAD